MSTAKRLVLSLRGRKHSQSNTATSSTRLVSAGTSPGHELDEIAVVSGTGGSSHHLTYGGIGSDICNGPRYSTADGAAMLSTIRQSSTSKQQQLLKQIWRTLSTTSQRSSNVKHTLTHDVTSLPEEQIPASTGTIDSKFLQSILAEWDQAKPFSKVPGPTRFQMMRGFMRGGEYENLSFIDLVNYCRQKYGDICLIPGTFGQSPFLSIFNPIDFERVHRTEGKWPIRPGGEVINYYRQNRKDGFFNASLGLIGGAEDWAHVRSAVNPVLMKPQNARLYLEPMLRISSEFVQRIREIRDAFTQEVPDTFVDDLNHLTFESIAAVALDKELGLISQTKNSAEAQQLLDSSHVFIQSMYELSIKPSFYRYFRTPTYKRFEKALDTIFDISKKYVDDALERFERQTATGSSEGKSVLEKLLKIDRTLAVIMALDMLQAGVEPTTSTLAGALLLLAKNPEKQAKLRREILNAVSTNRDAKFTIENMHHLPYLRACIKESIRLYPVIPGNFRLTGMDIVLAGYRIPRGTRVIINSNLLLTEERYFPRAHDFIPERWIRGDDERLVSDTMHPFVYLPFGFGPRTCAGKRIVDLQLELTLANLVRNFKIEFNYPTDKAFKCEFINTPAIPLKFKFTDL